MFKTSFFNVDMVINHRILYNSIGVQALMKKSIILKIFQQHTEFYTWTNVENLFDSKRHQERAQLSLYYQNLYL